MINNESLLMIVENDGERCTQNITLQRTSDSRSEEKPLE